MSVKLGATCKTFLSSRWSKRRQKTQYVKRDKQSLGKQTTWRRWFLKRIWKHTLHRRVAIMGMLGLLHWKIDRYQILVQANMRTEWMKGISEEKIEKPEVSWRAAKWRALQCTRWESKRPWTLLHEVKSPYPSLCNNSKITADTLRFFSSM